MNTHGGSSHAHQPVMRWCLTIFAALMLLAVALSYMLANHAKPPSPSVEALMAQTPMADKAAAQHTKDDLADPMKEREIRQIEASDTDRQIRRFGEFVLLPSAIIFSLILVIRRGFLR
jgi:hypothetical protein